jgi:hypothetical protein
MHLADVLDVLLVLLIGVDLVGDEGFLSGIPSFLRASACSYSAIIASCSAWAFSADSDTARWWASAFLLGLAKLLDGVLDLFVLS